MHPDGPEPAAATAPSNNAFKLTRSDGLFRMEALRATMRRCSGPSQLNAMFGRRQRSHRSEVP
jgi:hypothetical protein